MNVGREGNGSGNRVKHVGGRREGKEGRKEGERGSGNRVRHVGGGREGEREGWRK